MIDQVVCPDPVAAIFFSLELAPLRLLDFSRNRRNDHITPLSLTPARCRALTAWV